MKVITKFMTKNDCYKAGRKIKPKGIMVHSTATPGIMAADWFSRWNKSYKAGEINRQVCVHAFLDDKEVWQYLPWDHRGWHGGGSSNDTHIGFEICEPGGFKYGSGSTMIGYDVAKHQAYFDAVYENAIELCVMLCKQFGLTEKDIICHSEGYKLGIASNHGDVMHWFPKHGKNMDTFRAAVKSKLAAGGKPAKPIPVPASITGEETIWKFFKGKGLNDYAIAGIMGNLYAESGLRSNNLQNSYVRSLGMTDEEYTKAVDCGTYTNFTHDSAGYGLAQWTYWSRKEALLKFVKNANASIGDLATQLAYLWKELQGYANTMKVLKNATSVRQASDVVLLEYERPADQSEAAKVKRAKYGQSYYDKYATKPKTPAAPAPGVLYYVQTGAFSKKANADAQYHKVKAAGFDAIIKQSGNLYRVQAGAFGVKANAEALAAKLKAKGFDTYITTTGGTMVQPGSAPAPAKKIEVGSKVKIKKSAAKYSTGQNIPGWVKENTHTVRQISGQKALLKEIVSWVNLNDLTLA